MATNASATPTARPRRKPGQRLAPHERVAIQARALVGIPNAQTSRELGFAQQTIARVLNSQDMCDLREHARSDIHQMLPKAVKVIDYRLDKKSETAAALVLKGAGVLAPDQQVNVGIFAQQADVDIKGLMDLAGDSTANGAPITGESATADKDAEQVPVNNSPSQDAQ